MKIVLVGGDGSFGSMISSFSRAFTALGHEVRVFADENVYWADRGIVKNRFTHRLFWRFFSRYLARQLLDFLAREKPDFIIVVKGWFYPPSTFSSIRTILPRAILFNFNVDSPFNTWGHFMSNSWVRKSIPLFDAYCIWGRCFEKPLLAAGAQRFLYVPCGYDEVLHYPVQVSDPSERSFYGSDVAFIGTWDPERDHWLSPLADYNLKIWGNSWEHSSRAIQSKWQRQAIVGDGFSKVCNASKIIINIVRRQNLTAHNMRTFEVPACGGFMLATRTPEQEEFFVPGREADYFSSPDELRLKIDYYLAHASTRAAIAAAGLARLQSEPYSYKDRVLIFLNAYQECIAERGASS